MAIFFFITGFLIPLSLDKLEDSKKFLIRRAFRLFPILVFSISVVVIIHLLFGFGGKDELYKSNLKLLKSIFYTLFSIDFFHGKGFNFFNSIVIGQAWSLAVEWKFYLIAALSWFIFKDSRSRLYGMIAIIGTLIALVLYSNNSDFVHRLTFIYVCLVGSATYSYYSKSISKKEFLIISLILLTVIFETRRVGHFYLSSLIQSFSYIFGSIISAIIVLKLPNFGNNKICKFFADISYSMYLLHSLALRFVFNFNNLYIYRNCSEFEKLFCGICVYFVFSPFCYLIYKYIEKPFIKIGYRLTDGVKK